MTDDARWFVGIDWASETHQVCLIEAEGGQDYRRERISRTAGTRPGRELCDLVGVDDAGRSDGDRRGDRGAARPDCRDAAGARFSGLCDKPEAARPLPGPLPPSPAPKTTAAMPTCSTGRSWRTDRHCFRRLAVEDPIVIELREWSRMAEDLQQERNRLANRVREQLWRYYPQALKISDDLGADWFLELWAAVPTPAKAARVARESRVTGLLKAHRIRRIETAEVLRRSWARSRSSSPEARSKRRVAHITRGGGAPQIGQPAKFKQAHRQPR